MCWHTTRHYWNTGNFRECQQWPEIWACAAILQGTTVRAGTLWIKPGQVIPGFPGTLWHAVALQAISGGPTGEESPEDAAKGPVHKSIKIFTLKAPTLWKLCTLLMPTTSGLSKEVIGTCCTFTPCTVQKPQLPLSSFKEEERITRT